MGLWNFITGGPNRSLLSEIRNGSDPSVVVWKHTDEDFNTHSHLYLSPNEMAVFTNVNAAGKTEVLVLKEGGELKTNNIPFFRSITEKFSGGVSRFHCAVYFVRVNLLANNFWGTRSQIGPLEDVRHYTFKLSLRGTYDMAIKDVRALLDNILGYSDTPVTQEYLNSIIKEKVAFEASKLISAFFQHPEFKASLPRVQQEMMEGVSKAMEMVINEIYSDTWGVKFSNFTIIITDRYDELAPHYLENNKGIQQTEMYEYQGDSYQQIQIYNILKAIATNPGNPSGNMMGMVMGTGMGESMGSQLGALVNTQLNRSSQRATTAGATATRGGEWPGLPTEKSEEDAEKQRAAKRKLRQERLRELKEYYESGDISAQEYEKKKEEILNEI